MLSCKEDEPHTPHTLTPLIRERDRGVREGVRGCEAVRQIVLEDLPAPYVTTQAAVTQAMGEAAPDPVRALLDAEGMHRRRALRSDRLLGLHESRRITASELRAGSEMRMVAEWQAGAFQPIAQSVLRERLVSSAYDGDGQLWIALTEIEHTRYLPWLDWARTVQVAKAAEATIATLLRRVVIEGLGLRQVEADMHLRNGKALGLLRAGLHRYAAIVGWQHGDAPPDIAA
jgi:hypothetical protein